MQKCFGIRRRAPNENCCLFWQMYLNKKAITMSFGLFMMYPIISLNLNLGVELWENLFHTNFARLGFPVIENKGAQLSSEVVCEQAMYEEVKFGLQMWDSFYRIFDRLGDQLRKPWWEDGHRAWRYAICFARGSEVRTWKVWNAFVEQKLQYTCKEWCFLFTTMRYVYLTMNCQPLELWRLCKCRGCQRQDYWREV